MSPDPGNAAGKASLPLPTIGDPSPRVSIIMAVYNGERFIEQALESVAAQTLTDCELLIVDDGSTDRTLAIAEAHAARDPWIRTLHTDRGGVAAARNQALSVARAPLVALQDHDDPCEPERLAVQAAFLDANPDVTVLGARAWYIGQSGRIHGVLEMEPTTRRAFTATRHEGGAVFALASSVAFRAHVARSLGASAPAWRRPRTPTCGPASPTTTRSSSSAGASYATGYTPRARRTDASSSRGNSTTSTASTPSAGAPDCRRSSRPTTTACLELNP